MGSLESEDYEQSLNGMSEWYCGSWTLCPDEADHQKTNTLKCMRARETASEHATLQACTRSVQACRTACSLASHVGIDTRRRFRLKRTPAAQLRCSNVVLFSIDSLFLLDYCWSVSLWNNYRTTQDNHMSE